LFSLVNVHDTNPRNWWLIVDQFMDMGSCFEGMLAACSLFLVNVLDTNPHSWWLIVDQLMDMGSLCIIRCTRPVAKLWKQISYHGMYY
jgi:hypothetical protein